MIPLRLNQSLSLHFPQFIGHCAAVYAQVIGQLLAVERDHEVAALLAAGLEGQVGHQAAADGFGGGVEYAPG